METHQVNDDNDSSCRPSNHSTKQKSRSSSPARRNSSSPSSKSGVRNNNEDQGEGRPSFYPTTNVPDNHVLLIPAEIDLEEQPISPTTSRSALNREDYGANDVDDDDSSSASSEAESLLMHPSEMKFSLVSNALFLLGSGLQTYMAAWDVMAATGNQNNSSSDPLYNSYKDDDDMKQALEDGETADNNAHQRTSLYQTLYSMGPFLFIVNAMVDVRWALGGSQVSGLSFVQIARFWWTSLGEREHVSSMLQTWDLSIAVFFGFGAIFEFYSTLVDDDNVHGKGYTIGYYVNMVSMHTYLISGLLAIQKDRALLCAFGRSPSRCLMSVGVLLFLMGSVLDCVISYLYDPELLTDNIISEVTLTACNLSSSVLWFIDAILYIWADCLIFSIFTKLVKIFQSARRRLPQRTLHRRAISSQLSMPLVPPPRRNNSFDQAR